MGKKRPIYKSYRIDLPEILPVGPPPHRYKGDQTDYVDRVPIRHSETSGISLDDALRKFLNIGESGIRNNGIKFYRILLEHLETYVREMQTFYVRRSDGTIARVIADTPERALIHEYSESKEDRVMADFICSQGLTREYVSPRRLAFLRAAKIRVREAPELRESVTAPLETEHEFSLTPSDGSEGRGRRRRSTRTDAQRLQCDAHLTSPQRLKL